MEPLPPVSPGETAPDDDAPAAPSPSVSAVGDELECVVEDAVPGGRCLARIDGKIVLVAGALPGERVRIRFTRDEARWAEAETVAVLEPHARRRTPPCPVADECGGCDLQHAERDLQLAMKRSIVLDAFRRIGGMDVTGLLEGPEAAGPELGVRNRVRLTFDPAGRPGMLRRGSHDVVTIEDCPIAAAPFRDVFLPWSRFLPPWRRATVRSDGSGRVVVLFETGDPPNEKDRRRLGKITKEMERPARIVGLLADGVPLGGDRNLRFRVRGRELRADATSFFQVSEPGIEALVDVVDDLLGPDRGGQLLDVYAGVGLFGVTFGGGYDRVIAGEADRRAVRHLKRNLKHHAVRGEARGEAAEATLRAAPPAARETVILDPPRAGLAKEARAALIARAPGLVVSVSCDPATGARDAKALVEAGWRLERLVAVDLFPQTAHVETVARLVRDPAS